MTRRPYLHDELTGLRRWEGDTETPPFDVERSAPGKRRRMPAGWWTIPGILIGAALIVVGLRAVL